MVPCGSLQKRVDDAAAGSTLDLTGCAFAAGGLISKPLTLQGGTILLPPGQRGLVVTSSGVTISGVRITGDQASSFHSDEVGIVAKGTTSQPIEDLVIRGCELGHLGYGGVYVQFVRGFSVEGNTIHDGVYAGIMVLSGQGGRISNNTVQRIGVEGAAANGNNAYGIAITRGEGSLTVDPRSADIMVSGNVVEDVPTWHAYDTHGGEQVTWTANVARGSRSGIFVTGSNSPDGVVRSLDNDIDGNSFYAPDDADHYAVTVVYSDRGYIRNNLIAGWPTGHAISIRTAGDPAATAEGLTITDNNVIP
jgi:parallel beta-helix repeat protein